MMRWTHAMFITGALLVAGCSSNDTKELPPAELKSFKSEVELEKQWSRSVGDGQGKTWNQLELAVEGDTLFAADVTGEVKAMHRITGKVVWEKWAGTGTWYDGWYPGLGIGPDGTLYVGRDFVSVVAKLGAETVVPLQYVTWCSTTRG